MPVSRGLQFWGLAFLSAGVAALAIQQRLIGLIPGWTSRTPASRAWILS